jgi:putative copper export protein
LIETDPDSGFSPIEMAVGTGGVVKALAECASLSDRTTQRLDRETMTVGLVLHILGAIVWVGGMFFAYMVLRPAAGEMEGPTRLACSAGSSPGCS